MPIEEIINNSSEDNNKEVLKDSDNNDYVNDLRPKILKEYVGQIKVVDSLRTAIKASEARNEAMEHVLFHGPPGLGKTTLAHVISKEKKSNLVVTSGQALKSQRILLVYYQIYLKVMFCLLMRYTEFPRVLKNTFILQWKTLK